ncbi:MAG: glycosyltransferase family 4 protein [Chloroflexota bacterium]
MGAKNLLFVTHYTGIGGGEMVLLNLAQHLDRARYTPHLLVPGDGQVAERWRALGGPVHIIPFRGATEYFIPAIWARFPIVGKIEALIREQRIDALHTDYHSLPMALPAAERAGIPTMWTCMGWWTRPKPWQYALFRRPTATMALDEAVRDGYVGQPPFMPPEEITLVFPGVDTSKFHPGVDGTRVRFQAGIAQDAPVVALVARFQQVKGHEVFQAMARQVALQIPEARFIVAGENVHGQSADEAYKQRILQAAKNDPLLRDRLVYLGFRDDVERVMAAADVLVCSSQFESYGMAIVEAMACAKPVVATRRGGPSETVVHGETGFLVDPGDAEGLARHVITLLQNPDLRARIGAAGRARVEARFSAQAQARDFMAVADRVIGQRR